MLKYSRIILTLSTLTIIIIILILQHKKPPKHGWASLRRFFISSTHPLRLEKIEAENPPKFTIGFAGQRGYYVQYQDSYFKKGGVKNYSDIYCTPVSYTHLRAHINYVSCQHYFIILWKYFK